MSQRQKHRPLVLSNIPKGKDVAVFQRAVNQGLSHYRFPKRIKMDGIYGPETHHVASRLAIAMGVTSVARRKIISGRMPIGTQRLIEGDRRRTDAERQAHNRRVRYRRRLRQRWSQTRPIIYSGVVSTSSVFGSLGTPEWITGHYTGSTRDTSDQHAIQLCKGFDGYHRGKGWGGSGYHYNITIEGNIILLRPIWQKGAHVGGFNSNNVGIVMHGTTGDRPNPDQARAYQWLLRNAHTIALPQSHRSPVRLDRLPVRGHNDWAGHTSNGCPGSFKQMYLTRGERI